LVRDDNKGNIEKIASGRSIENNQIGAMDVDWTVSGDPQVVLGTSNSGDNGAEVYYYNGHVWTNFGIKTHAGDWGRDNAVIAMSVFWQGDSAVPQTPKIVAGTNYGEVKYYDPARNGWFDLVRDDNKGNIENIANGKSIKGNAVLALQAYWPATGDPQVVISTNNSGDNGAEVYYYDSHNWTNFGVKTHDGDWGKDNSAPVLRVYWPLNDDLTFKGNGTPYIVAATTYGEVKVFNPTIGAWRELLVGGGNNDYINAGNINGIPSLLPGHKIYTDANAELQSHGISGFFAMMQEDGNFVLYKQYADGRTESLWASDTVGHGDYMDFNGDWGILAVHDGNNGMSYQSNNKAGSDGPYSLVVQGDGNMVIYGHSGVRWSSDTMQYCSPHSGTCYTK
jgi:hypothetical protein